MDECEMKRREAATKLASLLAEALIKEGLFAELGDGEEFRAAYTKAHKALDQALLERLRISLRVEWPGVD
jgi:hypothetical protein